MRWRARDPARALLVQRLLHEHYDPAYHRSMLRNYRRIAEAPVVRLEGAGDSALDDAAGRLLLQLALDRGA